MNYKVLHLFFVLFLLVVFSCSKEKSSTEPDTTPPEIEIIQPLDGDVIRDSVMIKVDAVDTRDVEKVEFYINGYLLAEDLTYPYESMWIADSLDDGEYQILCKAIDTEGNEALSPVVQVTISKYILTANVQYSWMVNYTNCFIIVSDQDGVLLDEKMINSPGLYTFVLPPGYREEPESLVITNSRERTLMDGYTYIYMYSEIDQPLYSKRSFKGSTSIQDESEIVFNLENIPEHNRYFCSTQGNFYAGIYGNLETDTDYYLWPEILPGKVFINLDSDQNGPIYYYFDDLDPGVNTFDLSNYQLMSIANISYPDILDNVHAVLYGYLSEADITSQSFLVDLCLVSSSSNDAQIYYPNDLFSDYHLHFIVSDSDYDVYTDYYGDIPEEVEFLDTEIDVISLEEESIQFTTTGDNTLNYSRWTVPYHANPDFLRFNWYIYGPQDCETHSLIELSQDFLELYSQLIEEDMPELFCAGGMKYENITSYDNYIDVLYSENDFLNIISPVQKSKEYYPDDDDRYEIFNERYNSLIKSGLEQH